MHAFSLIRVFADPLQNHRILWPVEEKEASKNKQKTDALIRLRKCHENIFSRGLDQICLIQSKQINCYGTQENRTNHIGTMRSLMSVLRFPIKIIVSYWSEHLGPVVQSVVSLMSSLRVISLTVLADSIYNILIFFAEKIWVAFALQKLLTFFFSKKFQHICICVSLDVTFNESLTNNIVSFEQLGPEVITKMLVYSGCRFGVRLSFLGYVTCFTKIFERI